MLLTDPNTSHRMVIERKSVSWPPNYLYRHRLGHDFADGIWKQVGRQFSDGSYKLTVSDHEFDRLTKKEVEFVATEIGATIAQLSPKDLPIRGTNPLTWSLRRAYPGEDDDVPRKGIAIIEYLTAAWEGPD
ncbi:MAG: hypothetical protein WA476_10635, partial [Acidobacteriaceae bacterium]